MADEMFKIWILISPATVNVQYMLSTGCIFNNYQSNDDETNFNPSLVAQWIRRSLATEQIASSSPGSVG